MAHESDTRVLGHTFDFLDRFTVQHQRSLDLSPAPVIGATHVYQDDLTRFEFPGQFQHRHLFDRRGSLWQVNGQSFTLHR